jgi:hypothetical protein
LLHRPYDELLTQRQGILNKVGELLQLTSTVKYKVVKKYILASLLRQFKNCSTIG